ncbi:MAG TPA: hypothetical protein VFC03_22390 [Acidimicrobiales bacterium]|nr:hypothetical protein [Acidimicrobiales bacterium]
MPIARSDTSEAAVEAAVSKLTTEVAKLIQKAAADREIRRTTSRMKIATAPLAEWASRQTSTILAATAPELQNVRQAVRATTAAGGEVVGFSPPPVPKIRSVLWIYVGHLLGWLMTASAVLLLVGLWSGQVMVGGSVFWWSVVILVASAGLVAELAARIVEHGLGGGDVGASDRTALGIQVVLLEGSATLAWQLWTPAASAIGLFLSIITWIVAILLIIALVWLIGIIGYFDAVPVHHERYLVLASVGSLLALVLSWSVWQLLADLTSGTGEIRQILVSGAAVVFAGWGVVKAIRSTLNYRKRPAPELEDMANVRWSTQTSLSDAGIPSSAIRPFIERRQLSKDLFKAAEVWRHATLQRGILPLLRNRINEISKPGYSIELRVHDAPGLRQMHSTDFIVHTRAFKELVQNISAIRSGAIGLAGPRGAGKTTLLQAIGSGQLTGGRPPKVMITESVPVKYDARDFVLHLYGRTCDAVISLAGAPVARAAPPIRFPVRTWARLVLFVAVWAMVAVLGYRALRALQDGQSVEAQLAAVWWPFMIGVALLGSILLGTDMLSALHQRIRIDGRKPMNSMDDLLHSAEQRLTEVRFQQRYSSGWSGKISTPFGSEFSGTRTTELTEMVRSYPEIVYDFRSFLQSVIGVLGDDASGEPQLIVIIDELDKISTSTAAEEFINEIKSIFDLGHVSGYLYLVSVSEEALASFEQEGLTARDAFNSAFDDILRIDYLGLADTYTVLQSRIIGLAEPFLCLCHCLSGGLPREIIRVARKVVDQTPDERVDQPVTLGTVTSKVMVHDLRDRFHGLEAAVDGIDECEPYASDLLNAVRAAIAEPLDPARLLEAAGAPTLTAVPADVNLSSVALTELFRVQYATLGYIYYAATMLEIFDDEMSEEQMRLGRDMDSNGSFDRLGSVRGQIARRPRQAWLTVTALRRVWQLTTVEPPMGLSLPHSY